MADNIKTRILIISDTHGRSPQTRGLGSEEGYDTDTQLSNEPLGRVATGYRHPLPPADVLLHCGDLTLSSRLDEYKDTFDVLRRAPAKLKLVIAGNHDLSLDEDFCKLNEHVMEIRGKAKKAEVDKVIEDAKKDGVVFLEEGTHEFDLENGARIKVYASAWTPIYGGWAFQYATESSHGSDYEHLGHKFDIPEGVDVAMTHGPPKGVLDVAGLDAYRTNAGCDWLFDSVRKAAPRIHCFGHIHEAWGVYLARWQEDGREGEHKRKAESIDEGVSETMDLDRFWPGKGDNNEESAAKMDFVKRASRKRGIEVDITQGDNKLETGKQTLFINAAIMDMRYRPVQAPWLIDVDLPASK